MRRLWLLVVALAACEVRKIEPADQPAAPPPPPPALTAERRALGEKAIVQDCQMCHALDLVDSQRLARAAWAAELKKMKGWGAPFPSEDEPLLVDVLSDRAGTAVAATPARELTIAAAVAEVAPDARAPVGDAKKGATLYQTACASCHGPTGIGGSGGPALIDRPVVHRARDFEQVVRNGRERMPAYPLETGAIHDLLAFLRQPH